MIDKLVARLSVLCLQEVHGLPGDECELGRRFPRHKTWTSFGPSAAMGGVSVIVGPDLVQAYPHWITSDIVPGRVFAATGSNTFGSISFVSVHVQEIPGVISKEDIIQKLSEWCSTSRGHACFLCGDWNFMEDDECRLNLDNGRETFEKLPHANLFYKCFSSWCELWQEAPTRIGKNSDGHFTTSRLDRIYTDMPAFEVDIRKARVTVRGGPILEHPVSDHRPVLCMLEPPGAEKPSPSIPAWLCRRPDFQKIARELHEQAPGMESFNHVSELLAKNTAVLHAAACQVRESISRVGASSAHEVLHQTTLFAHAVRAGNRHRMKKAAQAVPELQKYIGFQVLPQSFHDFLGTTTRECLAFEQGILSEDTSSHPEQISRKQALLSKRQAVWSPRRRRCGLEAVLDEDGLPAPSMAASARLLVAHWQPVFSAGHIDVVFANMLLQHAVGEQQGIQWDMSKDDFLAMAAKIRCSAPGPNGVPFAALLMQPGMVEDMYAVYATMVDESRAGQEPTVAADFNDSLTAFIPKLEPGPPLPSVTKAPDQTRPITLSNCDAKFIARAVGGPLAHLAGKTCVANQHGMLRGRQLPEAVLSICKELDMWCRKQGRFCGGLFLDMKRAFPSISRHWLKMVLKHLGCPCWFIRLVFTFYRDCNTKIMLAGVHYEGFCMEEGVKQGCVMSGALFCLALDPWLRMINSRLPAGTFAMHAFADDVAFALRHLLEHLRLIGALCVVLQKGTGLHLNLLKCIFVPWALGDLPRIHAAIAAICPRWASAAVKPVARYLGVMVGPLAEQHQWTAIIAKMRATTRTIRALNMPLLDTMRAYNSTVHTIPSHVLQFATPTQQLYRAERWCIQFLFRAPWQAVPTAVLHQLSELGFRAQFQSIRCTSPATLARVALRSPTYWQFCEQEPTWSEHDLLASLPDRCFRVAPLHVHRQSVADLERLAVLPANHASVTQKAVAKAIRPHVGWPPPAVVITARMTFILGEPAEAAWGRSCVDNLKWAARPKQGIFASVRLSVLRFIFNAWPTAHRTGMSCRTCPWCQAASSATAVHMLHCPSLLFSWQLAGDVGSIPTLKQAFLFQRVRGPRLKCTMRWLDLLYQILIATQAGQNPADCVQICKARLRMLRS